MTPKSGAERMRELRERRKREAVDNPITRDEIVTMFVTLRHEIVTEIVTKMRDEIERHIVITPSSGPKGPSEEGGEMRDEKRDALRDAKTSRNENGARPWTNSFTATPGEIPRCPGCKHLIVNCQCDRQRTPPPPRPARKDLA